MTRQVYAENQKETAVGLHAISVPVRDATDAVLAALTLCIPTSRMNPARRPTLIADMQEAGRRLSDGVTSLAAWNAARADPRTVSRNPGAETASAAAAEQRP